MRAWLLDKFEGLSNLRLAEVADPVAERGEVIVDLQYAALNPADYYLAQGQYPAQPRLPHVLGGTGSGRSARWGRGRSSIRSGRG